MSKTYEDGLREGQIESIKADISRHCKTIVVHDRRISLLEKVAYVAAGVTLAVQGLPEIANIVKILSGD